MRDGGSLQPRTPAPDGCKKQIQCHADHYHSSWSQSHCHSIDHSDTVSSYLLQIHHFSAHWLDWTEQNINPNSEGVPATHLSEGGGHIVPPPAKCSINGPNELKFCV